MSPTRALVSLGLPKLFIVLGAPTLMAPKKKEAPEDPGKVAREYVNPTPAGELKSMDAPMTPAYLPHEVEAAWNDWWESKGYYRGNSDPEDKRPKFSICLPPPNVTGSLHLGHALTVAVQVYIYIYTHPFSPEVSHPSHPDDAPICHAASLGSSSRFARTCFAAGTRCAASTRSGSPERITLGSRRRWS